MLQQGDHAAFPRSFYWHHAIVEEINYDTGDITVIEYDGPFPKGTTGKKADIQRRTFDFKKEKKLYRIRYGL